VDTREVDSMRISKRLDRILHRVPRGTPSRRIVRLGPPRDGLDHSGHHFVLVHDREDLLDDPAPSPPPRRERPPRNLVPTGPVLPPGIGGLVAYISPSIMVVVGY
jgi:hypothetical protein